MRLRTSLFIIAFFIVPILFILTNPDTGIIKDLPVAAEILTYIVYISRAFIGVVLLMVVRKLIHDYPSADVDTLLKEAITGSTSAAIAIVGMAVFSLSYAVVIFAVLSV